MTLKIIVAGAAKTGKSTLAQEIAAALRHCGFPVDYHQAEPPASRERQQVRLDAIKARLQDESTCIVVEERATQRAPTFSDRAQSLGYFKRPEDTEGGSCD